MNSKSKSPRALWLIASLLVTVFGTVPGVRAQESEAEQTEAAVLGLEEASPELLEKANAIRSLIREGSFSFAISRAREFAKAYPDEVLPGQVLANALYFADKKKEAIEVLESLCEAHPDDYRIEVQLGGLLLSNGEVDAAGERFASALEVKPRFVAALHGLSGVEESRGNLDNAVTYLERAIDEGEGSINASTLFHLGRLYNSIGRFDDTIQLLDTRLRGIRPDVESHVVISTAYVAVGRCEDAAKEVTTALSGDRLSNSMLLWAATVYRECGLYDDSEMVLSLLTESALALADGQRGENAFARGDYAGAVGYFEKASQADANEWSYQQRIVEVALKSGDESLLEKTIAKVLADRDASLEALDALGSSLETAQRYERAMDIYKEAMKRFPGEAAPVYRAAILSLAMNDPKRALKHLETLLLLKPDHLAAMKLQIRAYRQLGDWDNMFDVSEAVHRANMTNAEDALQFAGLAEFLGKTVKAIEGYRAVLAIDGSNVAALNNLSLLLSAKAEHGEAIDLARKASALLGDANAGVLDTLGTALLAAGEVRESVEVLERSVELMQADASVRFHLAQAYEADGREAEALSMYKAALVRGADYPEREETKAAIERLEK